MKKLEKLSNKNNLMRPSDTNIISASNFDENSNILLNINNYNSNDDLTEI